MGLIYINRFSKKISFGNQKEQRGPLSESFQQVVTFSGAIFLLTDITRIFCQKIGSKFIPSCRNGPNFVDGHVGGYHCLLCIIPVSEKQDGKTGQQGKCQRVGGDNLGCLQQTGSDSSSCDIIFLKERETFLPTRETRDKRQETRDKRDLLTCQQSSLSFQQRHPSDL